jgi:hypothetical protein
VRFTFKQGRRKSPDCSIGIANIDQKNKQPPKKLIVFTFLRPIGSKGNAIDFEYELNYFLPLQRR